MPIDIEKKYDIQIASAILSRAAERLQEHEWFSANWLFSVHPFPSAPKPPESVTFHVYRPGWFNDDRKGIHFETFLGPNEWNKRQVPIMMHIFHSPHIPGTSIKRRDVAKPFIDEVFDLVSSWPEYKFRAGRYGTQPFTHLLRFDIEPIDDQIASEFARLCLQLGPIMDRTLDAVLRQP